MTITLVNNSTNSQLQLLYNPIFEIKQKYLRIARWDNTQYVSELGLNGDQLTLTQAGYDKITNLITTSFTNGGALYTSLIDQHATLLSEFYNGMFGQQTQGGQYDCNGALGYYSDTEGIRMLTHSVYFGDGTTYFDLDDFIYDVTEQPKFQAGIGTYFKVDHSVLNLYSPDINKNYHTINKADLTLNLIGYSTVYSMIDSANVELITSGGSSRSYAYTNKNFSYNY